MQIQPRKIATILIAVTGFFLFADAFYYYATHDYYLFITSYAFNYGWPESYLEKIFIPTAIRFTLRVSYVISFIGLLLFQRWAVYLCLIAWLGQILPSIFFSYSEGHGLHSGQINSLVQLLIYIGAIAFCWPVLKAGRSAVFCGSALVLAFLIHTVVFILLFNSAANVGAHNTQYYYDTEKQELLWEYVTSKDDEALKTLLSDKSFLPVLRGKDCSSHEICNLISYAAEGGNIEIIKLLHQAGSPIDERDGGTGDTPIIRALIAGHINVAEYLAASGAHPLQTNRFGVPAFIAASAEGSPLLLEIMIKNGAPLNLRQNMPDMVTQLKGNIVGGVTPLMMAASSGRLDLIETLLKSGADPSLKDEMDHNIIDYAKSGRAPVIETRLCQMVCALIEGN